MTNYTYSELQRIWIEGGGAASMAPLMAAIALAESSGNPKAVNYGDSGIQNSYGLWQIGSAGSYTGPPNWQDPVANARMAVAKLKSQGLGAWPQTYHSGIYKKYMQAGVGPAGSVPGVSGSPATPPAAAALTADTGPSGTCLIPYPGVSVPVLGQLGGGCMVSKTEGRAVAGYFMILNGGVLLAFGVLVLAAFGLMSTRAGKAAVGAATGVTGVARKVARR